MGEECKQPTVTTTYLLAAINDTQGIIRAIDTKLGILMAIFAIPFTKLGVIYTKCAFVISKNTDCFSTACVILTIILAASWIIGFIAAFRGLIGLDNPSEHVSGTKPKGTFYGGGLFKPMGYDDIFLNNLRLTEKTLEQQLADLPATADQVNQELAFEHAKLVYIRTIKLYRMKHAFMFGFAWLVAGGFIWVISFATKG